MAGRPSFSCDVMEAIRPLVDDHVLDIVSGPLQKRMFIEDARGVVRCVAPLTHQLASPETPTRRGPNPGGIAPRGRRRTEVTAPPLPAATCKGCGAALPVEPDRARSRRGWCDACLPERRAEIDRPMQRASLAHAAAFAEATGSRPSHTPEASATRKARNREQALAQRAWSREASGDLDQAWYHEQVASRLATLTLPVIARATGVSTSAASKWRAGRVVPHPRHWGALAQLAGVLIVDSEDDELPSRW